jgi:hypothetical protein
MYRALPLLLLVPCLAAQAPKLGASPAMRYVDFSQRLAQPGVVVAVGTLGKLKEGKRERVAEGKLGSNTTSVSVSGTQYFKVAVTATVQPRTTFHGKADKLQLAFDVQLARLPDGNEQRQSLTGNAAILAEDQLALFVVAPREKGKGLDLLAVIPFDKDLDQDADAEAGFGDAMRDFYVINRRVHDLGAAIAAIDKAPDGAAKAAALKALGELVEQKVELRRPQNDGLKAQHVNPLVARARERLAAAAGDGGK